MATSNSYDGGPQLPNYMRKKMKRVEPSASPARARAGSAAGASSKNAKYTVKRSAPAKPQAHPAKHSVQAQAGRKPQQASSAATARRAAATKAARKRKKEGIERAIKALLAVAAILMAVIAIVWLAGSGDGASADLSDFLSVKKTFKEGVKLVGVDVSGLTADEATGLVMTAAEKKLKGVLITVRAGEQEITLDYVSMGMAYSIEKTLEDGLAYGRGAGVTDVSGSGAGEFDAEYTWSREAVEIALANVAQSVNVEPIEPYAEPITDWESEERFNYIDGVPGQTLDVEDTAGRVEDALRALDFQAEIVAVTNAMPPVGSLDEIRANTELIYSFTTKFSAPRDDETKQNRKFNIKKAADIINGQVVQPGAEWSFNTVVGPRTYELGWKGANGISGGKEYTTQAGGGICQVSTTLYNALLGGNFEIVDRRAHSIPSDYVEKGLDATVDTSGIDFVWKNNTEHPVYIFVKVSQVEGSSSRNTITVYIYGQPLPDGVEYKTRSVIISTTPRTDTVFTQDPAISTGYQKELVIRHDGYVAEAYLDKYVNGVLQEGESVLLHKDTYKGNPAEIAIGTGPALAFGAAVPEDWQIYGTPPTEPVV
ncbi:MAG TPA: VanW family protein [Clostridia bacterium]|nr:VanW family protein [Clostridia bacterium]